MDNFDFIEFGAKFGMFFVPFLFALCFHEFSHGLVAKWKGDRTAEMAGRLTLNPIPHMDIVGTLIVPLCAVAFGMMFFGWAKPVPVNSRNLKKPKWDLFWISLAGPASNIFLAVVASLILLPLVEVYLHDKSISSAVLQMLATFIIINLSLAIFNMIPINPLDGGKIFAPFLPVRWNYWLQQNETMLSWVMILVFYVGGYRFLTPPIRIASELLIGWGDHLAQMIG
jgi:Zn-dependent protease